MEWATQLVLEAVKQETSCSDTPREFLMHVIADHWHEEGAIAFWEHAMERDGKPHPEADEDILRVCHSASIIAYLSRHPLQSSCRGASCGRGGGIDTYGIIKGKQQPQEEKNR